MFETILILSFFHIFYIHKYEGECLKRAHLANTHSQGFFQGVSLGFYMSPLGVEPVLPNWKVVVVTASPPSRKLLNCYNELIIYLTPNYISYLYIIFIIRYLYYIIYIFIYLHSILC